MQRTYQLPKVPPTRAEGSIAELLKAEGRHQRFAAGTLIQQRGDCGDGFWLIEAADEAVAKELALAGSKACNRKVELRPLLG